jgi:light-regulated signal transduction histidine kinase (bacteriophytochrome)
MSENKIVHFEDYHAVLDIWISVSVYPSEAGLSIYFKDITAMKKYTREIEEQNKKLREIAWMQSHEVRAPLARILGLINLITNYDDPGIDQKEMLGHIKDSSNELDQIIRKIVRQTEEIKPAKDTL